MTDPATSRRGTERPASAVPYALLGLLEEAPRHGYDLKREYDALFHHARPLRFGQIYATLGRLERDGLVALDQHEPGHGPDRKRYVITGDGVDDLTRWLQAPERPEPYLHSTLFTKVVLALLSDRPADEFLDAQRAAHMLRMRELTALKQRGSLIDGLLADQALFHLEADLRWIDLTAARLDRLRAQVMEAVRT
jgi:DNA-binding PadR family transcriptional regulator